MSELDALREKLAETTDLNERKQLLEAIDLVQREQKVRGCA